MPGTTCETIQTATALKSQLRRRRIEGPPWGKTIHRIRGGLFDDDCRDWASDSSVPLDLAGGFDLVLQSGSASQDQCSPPARSVEYSIRSAGVRSQSGR